MAESFSGVSSYLIGTACLLVLWGGLAALSLVTEQAALWLAVCGAVTALAGVMWLYQTAAAEGAERSSFLNVSSRSLIAGVFLLLVEIIVMPVFCILYLLLYFDSTWKPFLIEVLGIAMCATGIMLSIR